MSKRGGEKKHKLPSWLLPILERFEKFTEKIIPYLLVVLAVLLILENPFWHLVELSQYEPWITILDELIVGFFVVDLIFKWFRVRHLWAYLKLYWLDIVAVFPFFLIFRMYLRVSTLVTIGKEIGEVQKIAHEAVLVREAKLIRETKLLQEARFLRELKPASRLLRVAQRFLRVLKARFHVAVSAAHIYSPGKKTKVRAKKRSKSKSSSKKRRK